MMKQIPGDDFPGEPCLISFPDSSIFKNILSASITGNGSLESPLNTRAKFYYNKNKNGVFFEKTWHGTLKSFNENTNFKSKYEKSLSIAQNAYSTGIFSYQETLNLIHPDCEILKYKKLSSELNFKNYVNRPQPTFSTTTQNLICSFRINTLAEKFLIVTSKSISKEIPNGMYYGHIYIWKDNQWNYFAFSRPVYGTSPITFGKYFEGVLTNKTTEPTITWLKQ